MIIKNKTKQTILSTSAEFMKSVKARAIGLISAEKPKTIVFKTRYGIHTFGMRYPIDVIILDDSNTVVSVKEHLSPNRFFLWREIGSTVIELPVGKIKQTKTEIGDTIYSSSEHSESRS